MIHLDVGRRVRPTRKTLTGLAVIATLVVPQGFASVASAAASQPLAAKSPVRWSIDTVKVTPGHTRLSGQRVCSYTVATTSHHGVGEIRIYRWRTNDVMASDSDAYHYMQPGRNTTATFTMYAHPGDRVYFELYQYRFTKAGQTITESRRLVDHDTNRATLTPWVCR
jgi:hypothetical protein